MLTNVSYPTGGDVVLHSDKYVQLGCDLRDLPRLSVALSSVVDIQECLILFVAEVSITYMDLKAADELIKWASTLPNGKLI
jgi:tRNA wybutosine-synthesizing protein 4